MKWIYIYTCKYHTIKVFVKLALMHWSMFAGMFMQEGHRTQSFLKQDCTLWTVAPVCAWNILRRNRDAEHTLGDIECLFAFCPANRLRNICAVFIHVFPKFYLENSWFWYVLHSVRTLRWSHQPDTIFEQHLKTAGHANPIITIAIRCVGAMVPFLSLLIDKPLPSCMEFMYRSCE